MRMCGRERTREANSKYVVRARRVLLLAPLAMSAVWLRGQGADPKSVSDKIERLTAAMSRTQAQLEESQRELDEMRAQLAALRQQLKSGDPTVQGKGEGAGSSTSGDPASVAALSAAVQEIRERQAMQEAQIATHEQSKVESASKYPVKVTGLVVLNAFANTSAVDMAATPTIAVPGAGSSGATMKQTVIGIDARGPHVFGANSYADLRVDFDGASGTNNSAGTYTGSYAGATGFLRLRTAHAGVRWENTDLAFALDRPILNPETPTSLTAIAVPALAWSGNLWTWNPQAVLTRDFGSSSSFGLELQGAFIDVADAPLTPLGTPSGAVIAAPSTGEQSRWPGVQGRVALLGAPGSWSFARNHLGVGGFFEPHDSTFLSRRYDSWAGTFDVADKLPAGFELTGNFYRGQALGGLGAGGYKDIVYRRDPDKGGYYSRALDDVGGWAQIKERFSERFELNGAYGIDNVFASELRRYAVQGGSMYQNLARNRTYTGNVIFSPSAYFKFSLEYRHLISSPIVGLPAASDILGLGAGYKF